MKRWYRFNWKFIAYCFNYHNVHRCFLLPEFNSEMKLIENIIILNISQAPGGPNFCCHYFFDPPNCSAIVERILYSAQLGTSWSRRGRASLRTTLSSWSFWSATSTYSWKQKFKVPKEDEDWRGWDVLDWFTCICVRDVVLW